MFNLEEKQIPKVAGFIKKLYRIVNTSEYSDIICWGDDGKTVKIFDFKELENRVLQFNFRHRNYHSFIRQLNMYGFNKMERSVATTACFFSHPLFKKGCEDNLTLIKTKHEIKRLELQERQAKLNSLNQQKMMESLEKRRKEQKLMGKLMKSSFQKVLKQGPENIFRPLNLQKTFSISEIPRKQYQRYIQVKQNSRHDPEEKHIKEHQSSLHQAFIDMMAENSRNPQKSSIFDTTFKNYFTTGQHTKPNDFYFQKDNTPITDAEEKKIHQETFDLRMSLNSNRNHAEKLLLQKEMRSSDVIPTQTGSFCSPSFNYLLHNQVFNAQPFTCPPQPMFYPSLYPNANYFPMVPYPSYVPTIPQAMMAPVPQLCYQPCQPLFFGSAF